MFECVKATKIKHEIIFCFWYNLIFGLAFLEVIADCGEIFSYFGPFNSRKHQNMRKLLTRCNNAKIQVSCV